MLDGIRLLRMARPQFLIAGITLFLIGAAWALLLGATFDLARWVLGVLIIVPAQLSVSYSNDYYDVAVDRLGSPTLFSGGSGVLVRYPHLRRPAWWAAVGLTACSLGLAVYFMLRYGYPVSFFLFVAVCYLLSWLYTAPPARLAYRGLGEVVITLFSGCLLPGMGYWTAGGTLDGRWLLWSIPLSLYGMAFTLAVAIPDEETDRRGEKMTWVARKGRRFGFAAIGVLTLAGSGFLLAAPAWFLLPAAADFRILGALSALPLAAGAAGALLRPEGRVKATLLANSYILSLAVFFVLLDLFLLEAAFRG